MVPSVDDDLCVFATNRQKDINRWLLVSDVWCHARHNAHVVVKVKARRECADKVTNRQVDCCQRKKRHIKPGVHQRCRQEQHHADEKGNKRQEASPYG